jgi:hypothetical protein
MCNFCKLPQFDTFDDPLGNSAASNEFFADHGCPQALQAPPAHGTRLMPSAAVDEVLGDGKHATGTDTCSHTGLDRQIMLKNIESAQLCLLAYNVINESRNFLKLPLHVYSQQSVRTF